MIGGSVGPDGTIAPEAYSILQNNDNSFLSNAQTTQRSAKTLKNAFKSTSKSPRMVDVENSKISNMMSLGKISMRTQYVSPKHY